MEKNNKNCYKNVIKNLFSKKIRKLSFTYNFLLFGSFQIPLMLFS